MHICKICGKDCINTRKLSYHIKQHNITPENYYRQFYLKPGEDVCENCGKPLQFNKLSNPFGKTCSRSCFGQNQLTRDRRSKTNIEKFGSENPFSSDTVKNQIKNTITERYGGIGLQSSIIKAKIEYTNNTKYGVNNPWKSKSIITEIKQNRLNKIEQFEKDNNCTEKQKLINIFGASWLSIENTLDCIWLDNNHKFIMNYELDKIKSFGPKFSSPLRNELEIEIFNFIKSIYNDDVIPNDTLVLNGKEIDIYIPKLKLGIEIDGDYWHSTTFKSNDYHFNKSILCYNKGIRLIHIQESLWKNEPQKYKSYLINVCQNKNYFEIKYQTNDYIILDFNFGLPDSINQYVLCKFSGPTKITPNVYGCGNVIYKYTLL